MIYNGILLKSPMKTSKNTLRILTKHTHTYTHTTREGLTFREGAEPGRREYQLRARTLVFNISSTAKSGEAPINRILALPPEKWPCRISFPYLY
jgi:hypothetical protein